MGYDASGREPVSRRHFELRAPPRVKVFCKVVIGMVSKRASGLIHKPLIMAGCSYTAG
jgi:hypothetical protein